MMWDRVVDALLALWNADATLTGANGLNGTTKIYPAQTSRPVEVPSVEWMVKAPAGFREWEDICQLQVDFWARGQTAARLIERHLMKVAHRDVSRDMELIEDVVLPVWILFLDARTHEYPKDAGVIHRSLDFELRTIREKYITAA